MPSVASNELPNHFPVVTGRRTYQIKFKIITYASLSIHTSRGEHLPKANMSIV